METPVTAAPERCNVTEQLKICCEAQSGDFCLFYKDLSEVPFRKVEFNTQYKVCLLFISGKELVGEKHLQLEREVFLSCAVGLNSTGGSRVSQRSEKKKMVVTDSFAVRISAERSNISAEESTRVGSEAQRGSRCRFYTDRSESPLRTEEFRSRACMVALTGKEILAKTVPHSEGTEVVLTCDVELEKDREEPISSGCSKGLKVTVFSVAMWSAAVGSLVPTATGLPIVLWQKFVPGSKEENNERTQQPLADNRDAGK
ncbi:uncharacterized protein LOC108923588 [Arapaima gigas]